MGAARGGGGGKRGVGWVGWGGVGWGGHGVAESGYIVVRNKAGSLNVKRLL